jgi:hypothetical protein
MDRICYYNMPQVDIPLCVLALHVKLWLHIDIYF